MAPTVATINGAPNIQVSLNRMRSSMPFHITPPDISTENDSAMPSANSAGSISTIAAPVKSAPPPCRSSGAKRVPLNRRKPSASAPAMWTMRKFHVSSGKVGRKGMTMAPPVSSEIDSPLSAAMWKAA